MNIEQNKKLQRSLNVAEDGIIGRGTYTTLFARLGAPPVRAAELALGAAVHIPAAAIDLTPLRFAHFFAQLGHESGGFRYMEEIASGQAYEGRQDLGNVQQGDGRRFKGRGPIQLTGRANYRQYGRRLGIDFENHPEIVAFPSVGLMVACSYWQVNGLNDIADADNVEKVTRRINGGLNGFDDRKARLAAMKGLMGI
jgi:putative chitinase